MVNKTESIIASDVSIKGNITEKENIVIDGKVIGNIMQNLLKPLKIQILKGTSQQKVY